MQIHTLPKKIFVLLCFLAAVPFLAGVAALTLSALIPEGPLGAATAFVLVSGVVFFTLGSWALYGVLFKVALRVEIVEDIVSFYAALRTAAISLRDVKSIRMFPEKGKPLAAAVSYKGGTVYIVSTTQNFDELVHELAPEARTGFVNS